ncbi:hypothetical protein V8F33_010991 [Rhypophila sp. PSN 637]
MSARLDALCPELVCQILSMVDLASTCTRFNTIWTTNASTILTAVTPRCIPAFDDALVASRVTTLVKNSILEAKLPPKSHEINIHAFTAKASRPKIVDMGPVMGFHYVANVAEKGYLDGTALRDRRFYLPPNYAWYPRPPRHLPPDNHWSQTARVSFHRAVYRVLLAGSVLTGWHLEPFTLDVASTISFRGEPANMRLLGPDYEYDMSKREPRLGFLPQRQDYVDLRRYPAFDQGPKTTMSSSSGISMRVSRTTSNTFCWMAQSLPITEPHHRDG